MISSTHFNANVKKIISFTNDLTDKSGVQSYISYYYTADETTRYIRLQPCSIEG